MRYGRLDIPVPAHYKEDSAALDDLLEKGEIDASTHRQKKNAMNQEIAKFIAQSNNFQMPGRKKMRKMMKKIGDWKQEFIKTKTLEIAEQVTESSAAQAELAANPAS